ncbi:MAG: helix-turn-helix transcriptional regulator [Candidatus Hydrogenedentes bacterium]|nr:helix-turn-helix transcriptional regulator [Candidatus Hydrogenedentota bacterium]
MKTAIDEDRDLGLRIGIIVRRYREHQNMTQADLARQSKVTQAEVSYIEHGRRSHLKTLDRVAHALGMKLSDMIRGAEDIGDRKAVLRRAKRFIENANKTVAAPKKTVRPSKSIAARARAMAT